MDKRRIARFARAKDKMSDIAINAEHVVTIGRRQDGAAVILLTTGLTVIVDPEPDEVADALGFSWIDTTDGDGGPETWTFKVS